MKKTIGLLCVLLILLSFVGCNIESDSSSADTTVNEEEVITPQNNYDIDSLFDTNGAFEYVADEGGSYTLCLPNSEDNIKIYVSDTCLNHLSKIDNNLFLEAGRKIFSNLEGNKAPALQISVDSENYLYLYGEIIVDIDPPQSEAYKGEVFTSGCGIDHDHLYFRERISSEPILS